jgi:hypothetical protein
MMVQGSGQRVRSARCPKCGVRLFPPESIDAHHAWHAKRELDLKGISERLRRLRDWHPQGAKEKT